MEEERKKRYIEKIQHVRRRIEEFNEWKHEFFFDEKTRLACYKALQEIIDGCMDIVAMILKDAGHSPGDDYSNISLLEREGIIPRELSLSLRELNGLRNRIVCMHNCLDDEIALSSAEELLPSVERFLKVVGEWLAKG
jgi:uncharacterized protein YutE (UPF0331/DUF86 family)